MLTIRPMTESDDFAATGQVYADSWKHAYRGLIPQRYLDKLRPESWIGLLKANPEANLIALLDDQVIGTAFVAFARDELREGFGEIVSLYLLPDHIGKGYGRQLWQAAIEHCRQQGLSGVCLWVLSTNVRACRFYEQMGMQPSGRTKTEAIGGEMLPLSEYILLLEESSPPHLNKELNACVYQPLLSATDCDGSPVLSAGCLHPHGQRRHQEKYHHDCFLHRPDLSEPGP